MNLAVQTKSRRRPEVGDIFVLSPAGRKYLFGRVIATDANPLGVGDGILIYIYRNEETAKTAPPSLKVADLLVPPLITNSLPWSRGYFEHVCSRSLAKEDLLPQHCFWDCVRNVHRDEYGKAIAQPTQPAGVWGLHSYETIDDEVSSALGIPLSSD